MEKSIAIWEMKKNIILPTQLFIFSPQFWNSNSGKMHNQEANKYRSHFSLIGCNLLYCAQCVGWVLLLMAILFGVKRQFQQYLSYIVGIITNYRGCGLLTDETHPYSCAFHKPRPWLHRLYVVLYGLSLPSMLWDERLLFVMSILVELCKLEPSLCI